MRYFTALGLAALGLILGGCGGNDDVGAEEDDLLGAAEVLGPDPAGIPARFPFVLAHGLGGSPEFLGFFAVAEALRQDGHVVYEGEVPPFQAADVRAEFLAKTVDQALEESGAEKVNIIAHSMGGLDARALVSTLGYGDVVATVTTISTPHQGSAAADVALGLLDGLGEKTDAIDALAKAWGSNFSSVAGDPDVLAALRDISEANAPEWNAAHPDDPDVVYASWAGVSSIAGIFNPKDNAACDDLWLLSRSGRRAKPDLMGALVKAAASFVAHGLDLIPNDGLVTVESAKWGEFVGCMPADHADENGTLKPTKPNAITGFDHVRFYRNLAFDYADRGF